MQVFPTQRGGFAEAYADGLASTTARPLGRLSVEETTLVFTIRPNGHSIVEQDNTIAIVEGEKFDREKDFELLLGINRAAPEFGAGVPALSELGKDNRDFTLVPAFCHRMLEQPTSPVSFRLLDRGPEESSSLGEDWKTRRINLVPSRRLATGERVRYVYSWSTPGGFATSGQDFVEHRAKHNVRKLRIVLRFHVPRNAEEDPWVRRFEREPSLNAPSYPPSQANQFVKAMPTLHYRKYIWELAQGLGAGDHVRISWNLAPEKMPAHRSATKPGRRKPRSHGTTRQRATRRPKR